MKRQQIIDLFTRYGNQKFELWFSGIKGEGEYKAWHENGQLTVHCFYKNDEKNGEDKAFRPNGELFFHKLYKDDKVIKDYLE